MNDNSLKQEKPAERRRGERRRARTRADLLEAARQVFARRGYYDASIAEITELADVAVGTFYLYFRDKDDAFTTVLQEGFSETIAQVKEAIAHEEGEPALEVVIRAIFRHAYNKRDLFRVALMAGGQFARITRVQDAIEEVLTGLLDQSSTKHLLARYNQPLLVRFLTGMILQGIIWWFEQDEPDPAGMTEQLLLFLQHGLPAQLVSGDASGLLNRKDTNGNSSQN